MALPKYRNLAREYSFSPRKLEGQGRPDRYLPELWRSGAAAHACPSCGAYRGRVYREAVRSIHTK